MNRLALEEALEIVEDCRLRLQVLALDTGSVHVGHVLAAVDGVILRKFRRCAGCFELVPAGRFECCDGVPALRVQP